MAHSARSDEKAAPPRLRPPVGLGRAQLRNMGIYLALMLALFLAGPVAYPNQFFFFYLMDFLILTLGLNFIYGFTGYLPFGYTVFWGLGAYGIYIGLQLGLHGALAFIFAIAISTALAAVLLPLFRLRSHYFAIATLAALMAVYYLVESSALERWTNGDKGASLAGRIPYDPMLTYYITLAILLISLVLTFYVKYSRFGLALRAIRGSVLSAEMDGINITITRGLAWLLSALIASLAGAMYGWYVMFYYPDIFNVTYSVYVITYLIFGGAGTVLGPIVGTLILSSLYQFLDVYYTSYVNLTFGVILILLMLFMSKGLMGVLYRYLRRLPP